MEQNTWIHFSDYTRPVRYSINKWWQCGQVTSPLPFSLLSLRLFLFLTVPQHPNSALPTEAPQCWSLKKYFDITANPEPKWPSQQNILIFCFLYFTIFNSFCGHNFGRTDARKSSLPSRICLVEKVMHPKIKIPWSNSILTPIMLAFRECSLIK